MAENNPNTMIRTLTENYIREKIEELKNNPERGTRNLIDLALNTSKGRFQKNFFAAAQTMLQNQQSSYYKLIQDVIFHVDEEHLVTFGMNIGYNSLTFGEKSIRETENAEGFNIPWMISLCINETTYDSMEKNYKSLIEQGIKLGVYSWTLYAKSGAEKGLSLIKSYPDCAFLMIASPNEITEDFLDSAEALKNMVVSVKYDASAPHIYSNIRKRKMLYSSCVLYNPDSMTEQKLNDILSDINELHPAFTLFAPQFLSEEHASSFYDYILDLRQSQKYATVPYKSPNFQYRASYPPAAFQTENSSYNENAAEKNFVLQFSVSFCKTPDFHRNNCTALPEADYQHYNPSY